ncbi:TetR/AcrR family transcriptional regulator [Corynebacterium sp. c8Ua_181]|uniref:TetR/AcrR family transcriptional regulator n=1 Tax=Corynebacterium curieae TaxID=2913500 RepID=A0A9X3RTB5_9CORY|nr:TetR/AcrR family transcriptional regulator [Corynebacterium curieae]MCZ9306922.1 TetR/AcrR family transcriptional regulator [Corynebacterium curieae]MDV2424401.1 TetR/AcrR family transcriptional regulator [Corynebacterium curieae]
MASLREEKKRATRQAMADAAARLVLDGGTEAATVSGITAAVGVSPRTFHNYFSSVADALLYFAADVLEAFAAEIPTVCPGKSVFAVLEAALLESLEDEDKELRSLHTLYRIGEALDNLSHTSEERRRFERVSDTIISAFQQRGTDYTDYELSVVLNACAGGSVAIRQELDRRQAAGGEVSIEEKKKLVHATFTVLRTLD